MLPHDYVIKLGTSNKTKYARREHLEESFPTFKDPTRIWATTNSQSPKYAPPNARETQS